MPTSADHHFRFNLDPAIRDQLIEKLKTSPKLPLTKNVGPVESGLYLLYFKGALVYIGKASKELTKSARDLKTRLNEHVSKLSGRQGIALADMECQFLTFESEWWVVAAEFAAINHFKPPWNGSGYGSKVQGAGRPGMPGRVSKWNQMFPPLPKLSTQPKVVQKAKKKP